jgi:hypothetical protein
MAGGHVGEAAGLAAGAQEAGVVLDLAEEPLAGDADSVAAGDGDVAEPGGGLVEFVNLF